jgi:HK97 family phage prohead protease
MAESERRYLDASGLRAAAGFDGHSLAGYAAVFESLTDARMFGGTFREGIRRGAFARSLRAGRDVVALFNHDHNQVLGRLSNRTLRLREDERGLWFEVQLPDTSLGRDLHRLVERGDVHQCSFGFAVAPGGEQWERQGKTPIRWLTDVDLGDVSVVTVPAYPTTSVAARQFAAGMTSDANSGDVDEMARMTRTLQLLELEG